MNSGNKNPPSFESGFCLAPPAELEPERRGYESLRLSSPRNCDGVAMFAPVPQRFALRRRVERSSPVGEKRQNGNGVRLDSNQATRLRKPTSFSAAKLRRCRNVRPCASVLRTSAQGGAVESCRGKEPNRKPEAVASGFPFGSPCWTRTSDTLINSQVLYRLS